MTVTMSHQEQRIELPTHQSASTVFFPGVHVMLQDLSPATLGYGGERWTNPSLLNGSTGIIIRREKDLWIVELDKTLMVRFTWLNPVKLAGLAPCPLFPPCEFHHAVHKLHMPFYAKNNRDTLATDPPRPTAHPRRNFLRRAATSAASSRRKQRETKSTRRPPPPPPPPPPGGRTATSHPTPR